MLKYILYFIWAWVEGGMKNELTNKPQMNSIITTPWLLGAVRSLFFEEGTHCWTILVVVLTHRCCINKHTPQNTELAETLRREERRREDEGRFTARFNLSTNLLKRWYMIALNGLYKEIQLSLWINRASLSKSQLLHLLAARGSTMGPRYSTIYAILIIYSVNLCYVIGSNSIGSADSLGYSHYIRSVNQCHLLA